MKEIVKYHSKNKLEYIKNLIIISQKAILVSLLYWIYGLLICIFIFNKVFINNINDIFILIGFILLNYFVAIFIAVSYTHLDVYKRQLLYMQLLMV